MTCSTASSRAGLAGLRRVWLGLVLVESFWTTVARGAAQTQGVALPPIKHVKSGFSRMRAFCGDAEVTPIHRFKLEQRVSESDAIHEGLYVFDPGALGRGAGLSSSCCIRRRSRRRGTPAWSIRRCSSRYRRTSYRIER